MRMLFALIPAGTLLALTGPVVAQTGNDDAVNACIQAAKQQHQGLLTGWAIDRGGVGAGVEISMVTSDDKRWKLACTDGKIKDEEQRLGNKDYEMLSTRTAVPEVSARATAAVTYGNNTLRKMTYGLNWAGKAYYHYYGTTDDGRSSQIDVTRRQARSTAPARNGE